MTIEKKSLISTLKTTKKANVVKDDISGGATVGPTQKLAAPVKLGGKGPVKLGGKGPVKLGGKGPIKLGGKGPVKLGGKGPIKLGGKGPVKLATKVGG